MGIQRLGGSLIVRLFKGFYKTTAYGFKYVSFPIAFGIDNECSL